MGASFIGGNSLGMANGMADGMGNGMGNGMANGMGFAGMANGMGFAGMGNGMGSAGMGNGMDPHVRAELARFAANRAESDRASRVQESMYRAYYGQPPI